MRIKHIFNILPESPTYLTTEEDITVSGWVRSKRGSKKVSFIELFDGSCIHSLQVVASNNIDLKDVTTGTSIEVTGKIVDSLGAGQAFEMQATDIKVIGKCPADEYPLQKKEHSTEFLRDNSHLRIRTKQYGSVFRVRHALSMAVHNYFDSNGYFNYHTPILTAADCEGAGEVFKLKDNEFFGKEAHLTVSGQMEAELGALGLGQVYTFAPTFRAENSNTTKHMAEFWMIEPEIAFAEMDEAIDIAEDFIRNVFDYILTHYKEELDYLGTSEELERIRVNPFARTTYEEAINFLGKEWGDDIDTESEKALITHYDRPVIITDYPTEIKAFYMKRSDDNKTVKGFDIIFPVVGELVGGSQREEDYDRLVERMTELNISTEELSWYLDTRKFGTVPHSGFGLGFDRLVMFVTGMKNIRDVIPFPRTPKNIKF